ncbi:MAG: class I adenylate-forming enzyme family protein [Hyphomicrobiaceae bacterium]
MRSPYSRTMYDLLREQADRAPHGLAILTREDTVTFSRLLSRVERVAGALRADGIRRGQRVGLLAANRPEWLEVFFAAAALGATLVPFSTWSTRPELSFLLEDARVDILFLAPAVGDRDFAADILALRAEGHPSLPERLVALDPAPQTGMRSYAAYREGPALETLPPGEGASATDTMVILYTSGSSNRPKAVPLRHAEAIENGFNIGERQGIRPGDRVLASIPLFWSYGCANALPAVYGHGAGLVLQERFAAAGALDLIEQHRCTGLYTLPAMTNALVGHESFAKARTASLRTGVTIGSPQDVIKAAEELGATDICNIYGSTETYGNCCVTSHEWPLQERSRTQGHPLPGVTVRIRNAETGELCPPGVVGEVEVSGYLTPGYAGDSAQHNATVFTADGYFRTGDLGMRDEDGRFSYAGRSSEMIKRSGINVSPAEVEEVLQQYAAVGLAGVTGLADDARGELIIAFVVPRPDLPVDQEGLLAHCRERLSRYKIPDRILVRDSLPLTPTGKLMRRELKDLAKTSA